MLNKTVSAVSVSSIATSVSSTVASSEPSAIATVETGSRDGGAKDVGSLRSSSAETSSKPVGTCPVGSSSVGSGTVCSSVVAASIATSVAAAVAATVVVTRGHVKHGSVNAGRGGRGRGGAGLVCLYRCAEAGSVGDVLHGTPAAIGSAQAVGALLVAHAITALPARGPARGVIFVVPKGVGAGKVLRAVAGGSSSVAVASEEAGVSSSAGRSEYDENLHGLLVGRV